mmetsp:Transcript_20453/g.26133  ORF Transcript_20453/g.26133 Transcript_20453/m.26133 type:complete len:376 (+) Transcript_20453:205-1332(+)
MSACLDLAPAGACFTRGSCVDLITANISGQVCICEPGWEGTKEFNYWVGGEYAEQSSCHYPPQPILACYILATTTSWLAVVVKAYASYAHKRSRLHDNLAILSLVSYSLGCTYRVAKPETALFGHDVAFTFFVGNGFGLILAAEKVSFLRYMYSFVRHNEWSSSKVEVRINQYRDIERYALPADIVITQIIWLICFVEMKTALVLFRLVLGFYLLRALRLFAFSQTFKKLYLGELETVAKFKFNLNSKHEKSEGDPESRAWVKNQRRKAGLLGYVTISFQLNLVINMILPICWDLFVTFLTFIVPITCVVWSCYVLYYVVVKIIKRRARSIERELDSHGATHTRNDFMKHVAGGQVVRVGTKEEEDEEESEDELV